MHGHSCWFRDISQTKSEKWIVPPWTHPAYTLIWTSYHFLKGECRRQPRCSLVKNPGGCWRCGWDGCSSESSQERVAAAANTVLHYNGTLTAVLHFQPRSDRLPSVSPRLHFNFEMGCWVFCTHNSRFILSTSHTPEREERMEVTKL